MAKNEVINRSGAEVTAVAAVAGIGAAVLPDRRASRLNVLAALQYE